MTNPLVDRWLSIWDKLTGRRYRYRPAPNYNTLDYETRRFVGWVYQYDGTFDYRHAVEILERGRIQPTLRYRHFKKPKSDGTLRQLAEPDPTLKAIQRTISQRFLSRGQIHSAAVGYRRKMSIADHVWPHAGAKIIITADIQDFFPSTTYHRIGEWWATQFESPQAIKLATLLTTYHGSLPQGAPTSPQLSNIVNYDLDRRLHQRTERSSGTYTRYADDMIFSWQGHDRPPADFYHGVSKTLREFGYTLHPQKGWQEYTAKDEPEITGVVLRKRGLVTITDETRKIMQQLERNEPHSERLAGYRGFQKMIERP